jgi:hypothetical protein
VFYQLGVMLGSSFNADCRRYGAWGCDTLSEGRSTLSFNEECICQRRIPPYDFNLGIDNTRPLCKLLCPPE